MATYDPSATNSKNNCGVKASRPFSSDWAWLQDQQQTGTDTLSDWLTQELDNLENEFQHLVTPRSRSRSMAKEIKQGR